MVRFEFYTAETFQSLFEISFDQYTICGSGNDFSFSHTLRARNMLLIRGGCF